ncbi:S41 family peptidase [Aliikangiella coralliicola]|uniref:Peptidase n=1 Tax=Aliikangiella coralliicola TaxID=2592383 RepID=A0A545U7I8_9GAMM|nr:S41 family peptidase [Aliikangiella coralliicola]TQV85436.1 peptidase [Aliikangiella coralliicola]
MKKINRLSIQLFAAASLTTLLACGGGGGGDGSVAIGTSQPTWTAGVFADESSFKNLCQSPRAGTSDRQGTTLHENHWLRSWSNNTYLWYDEITDRDPALSSTALEYFALLKTEATTPSGNPKDQFHFTYDTEEWEQLQQSGVSAGYGAKWKIVSSAPPREIRVAYNEPNSPAASANLDRGAEILEIDGVDVVNAGDQASVNTINAGLFPAGAGETHTFTVRDIGSTQTRSISMTSAAVTSSPVRMVNTIDTPTGKVGYILFNSHIAPAEEGLVNAVNQLSNEGVNDLVLDLRYNGGGLLAIASQLAYMIAGPTPTSGRTFDNLTFNDKHTTTNPVTGQALSPTPFYDRSLGFSVTEGQQLPFLNLNRVFILSTDNTCSASEAIINGLRGVDFEVILIGSTTCGKPYGFYPTDNCGTTYFTIQFRGENQKGFGDYADGFSPANTSGTIGEVVTGCSVADDFSNPLGDAQEGQIAAALSYRTTGTCPTATGKSVSQFAEKSNNQDGSLFDSEIYRKRTLLTENRILTNSQ